MKAMTGLSGLSALMPPAGVTQAGPRAAGGSSSLWTNANAIAASDDSYATTDVGFGDTATALDAAGFGFAIPNGAVIRGIEVAIERSRTGTGAVGNTAVSLLKVGFAAGDEVMDPADWPASDAVATYGGPTSLWGAAWAAADVNDANFGARFVVDEAFVGDATLRVDQVRITIWYE